jgi:hypothetical protein
VRGVAKFRIPPINWVLVGVYGVLEGGGWRGRGDYLFLEYINSKLEQFLHKGDKICQTFETTKLKKEEERNPWLVGSYSLMWRLGPHFFPHKLIE